MKITADITPRFLGVALLATSISATASTNEKLWYDAPAQEWMQAIPMGNGRLSAMVYGDDSHERVALNEISMWSGSPDSTSNDLCGPEALARMRDAFFNNDPVKGNQLGDKYLNGRMTSFGTHVPAGDLVIDFTLDPSKTTDYSRSLDLSQAVTTVSFNNNGVRYTRQYITSYPDDILAIQCSASRKGAINATIGTDLLQKAAISTSSDGLTFNGKVEFPMHGPGGVNFCGKVKAIPTGGTTTTTDSTYIIKGADSLLLLLDLRTDYNTSDYAAKADATVNNAASQSFNELLLRHLADYQALYNRMSVDLGDSPLADLPTDQRLKRIAAGEKDPSFDALFFQYGRYMLISSSRPSGMPLCANLQGIWNDNGACNMPWTCDYHLDINTQQNYWSANRVNLAECNVPLFSYLGLLADHGRDAARKIYGCRGWVAHTVCNAWGYTAPGWGVGWGMNVTGGAWLATHLWSHYLYTHDKEYLRSTAYPILRESAQFFSDYMVRDPRSGYLMTGPSISPENGYKGPGGENLSLSMMPTIDRSMVHNIYTACIESARILGIDDDFTRKLRNDILLLPPLATDSDGLLCEWLDPVKRSDPSHRHSSHIHALFPLNQISYSRQPELIDACRKSLDTQTSDPAWEDTEWSTANMLCFRARTKEGDAAYKWLHNLYRRFMRENLMTVSPTGVAGAEYDIFSFDATEGAVAGMCEMLLQSYDGFLEFLPALPASWPAGNVKGLCAEGGITVDLSWENGQPKEVTLLATAEDTSVNIKGYKDKISLKKGQPLTLALNR